MPSHSIYITRCPSCLSKQQVNTAAFTLAAGKVSCVKCRCIFDAQKHRQAVKPPHHPTALPATIDKELFKRLAPSTEQTEPPANKTFSHLKDVVLIILCTLLLLMAVLQVIASNQQRWANVSWLQPVYHNIAQWWPHSPKSPAHFRQISLSILPAELYSNVMHVSFQFENISDSEQALPKVKLTFSNLQGNPVSQSIFDPQHYLNDQSLLDERVAPQVIVSAKLEILKPSKQGLNYQLQLINTHEK